MNDYKEGWGIKRPGNRVVHYYRNGDSLCGRVRLYQGELYPDNGVDTYEDCKGCRKKLRKTV